MAAALRADGPAFDAPAHKPLPDAIAVREWPDPYAPPVWWLQRGSLVHPVADVEEERVRIAAGIESDESMKGKPQSVIDKVLEGRLRKSLAEVCLSEQKLVTQPDMSVREAVKTRAGGAFDVHAFVRMEVGEGIARGSGKDFASEVHEQVAKSRA